VVYIDESGDGGSPDIRIGGNGIVNTSGLPSNLILYCLNDVVNIAISGSAAFYGGIYAPQATISLNSGAVYGSLVGREVDMNDAASSIHYDEVLRDQSNSRASIISWQEL
jgi:choice-of-anchor A domain-containing protein